MRVLVLLTLAACGARPADVVLLDGNNYTFSGTIDVPDHPTRVGDVTVAFSGCDGDLQCHPVDPVGDVDSVQLVRFGSLSREEVEAGLTDDRLQQADVSGYIEAEPGDATEVALSSMTLQGTPVDLATEYTPEGGTYLLVLARGAETGQGVLSLAFLVPTADSDVDRVEIGPGCGLLTWSVDLEALSPVPVPREGGWNLDWSGLVDDGQGNPFDFSSVDRLTLGHYPDLDVAALEERFLDLELIAAEEWSMALPGGATADLAEAVTDAGEPFTGFSGDGAWVLALRCSTCYDPAPLFLTLLEPVEG